MQQHLVHNQYKEHGKFVECYCTRASAAGSYHNSVCRNKHLHKFNYTVKHIACHACCPVHSGCKHRHQCNLNYIAPRSGNPRFKKTCCKIFKYCPNNSKKKKLQKDCLLLIKSIEHPGYSRHRRCSERLRILTCHDKLYKIFKINIIFLNAGIYLIIIVVIRCGSMY